MDNYRKFTGAAALVLLLSACGTMHNGKSWGEDVTLLPSSQRLADAAVNAATHPATWIPLTGAALFSAGNLDEKYTKALAENNYLFGSQQNANHASDMLRSSLVTSMFVTALITPSGTTTNDLIVNKTKGLITEYAALYITSGTTSAIKDATGRQRPNGYDYSSFPSGHTSRAFAAAALTSENLQSLDVSPATADGIRVGLYSIACGTAWARVEANKHYVTDVMAGAALGNFLSRFIHDAFMGINDNSSQIDVDIEPHHSNIYITLRF